jgi:hypothetical protein
LITLRNNNDDDNNGDNKEDLVQFSKMLSLHFPVSTGALADQQTRWQQRQRQQQQPMQAVEAKV